MRQANIFRSRAREQKLLRRADEAREENTAFFHHSDIQSRKSNEVLRLGQKRLDSGWRMKDRSMESSMDHFLGRVCRSAECVRGWGIVLEDVGGHHPIATEMNQALISDRE
ncbi:hypothetical protein ACJRO7_026061 [Eucalyptus globulus]|uniref:Uncharacterized protein n=1 Tax=Eucalyptus globulus TaxID=34317 RepID=A0ABD3KDU4_EUCGL